MTRPLGRLVLAIVLIAVGCSGTTDEESRATGSDDQVTTAGDESASGDGTEPNDADPNNTQAEGTATTAAAPPPGEPAPGGPGQLVDATEALGIEKALAGIRGHAVATADVNGDGWNDLFVGTFANRPVESYRHFGADGPAPDRLLLGSPSGFTIDPDFEGRLGRTSGALFADLDLDGDPDLVVSRNVRNVERGAAPSEIYRNDDGKLTPIAVLDETGGGRALVTTDFDGDGLMDLVQVKDRWSRNSTLLFRNEGDLRFRDVTDELGFPTGVTGLGAAVGDLNGDGLDDLVVGGSNRWFLGTGNGFREATTSPLPWALHNDEDDPAHVIITDTNDDGRADVLIGQHFNSTVDSGIPEAIKVFINDGPGGDGSGDEPTFTDATDASGMPYFDTKSPQILLLDIDADGRQDVVTTASSGADAADRSPVVVLNREAVDGLPAFDAPDVETGPHYWIDAVTIDANGDQRPDVFFIEWEPSIGSRLYLNLPVE